MSDLDDLLRVGRDAEPLGEAPAKPPAEPVRANDLSALFGAPPTRRSAARSPEVPARFVLPEPPGRAEGPNRAELRARAEAPSAAAPLAGPVPAPPVAAAAWGDTGVTPDADPGFSIPALADEADAPEHSVAPGWQGTPAQDAPAPQPHPVASPWHEAPAAGMAPAPPVDFDAILFGGAEPSGGHISSDPSATWAGPAPAPMDAPTTWLAPTEAPTAWLGEVEPPRRRGPSPRTWFIIGVVTAIALLIAVVIALIALNNRSSAPPAAIDAPGLAVLEVAEQDLGQQITQVNAAITRLEDEVDAAQSRAATFTGPLAVMQDVTRPFAHEAALGAHAAFVDAIATSEVPERIPPYQRGALDTTSEAAVRAARTAVEARAGELTELATSIEALRTELADAVATFRQAITDFIVLTPSTANMFLTQNPDAEASLRQAVVTQASVVATSDPFTPVGLATWFDYADAVAALRADQARVDAEPKPTPTPTPTPTPSPTPSPSPSPTPDPEPDPDPDPDPDED